MKNLIFSDTHLTPKYEPKKLAVLKDAIEQADQVIINGDFWEGMAYRFEDFVTSSWSKELFPLLKKKKAVYLFGNHDKERLTDSRADLFSNKQMKQYSFKSGENTYFVEHGDLLFPLPDLPLILRVTLEGVENIIFKIFGKTFIRFAYERFNNSIKRKILGKFKENEFLITGHTHYAEVDLKSHYINSGFNNYGIAQYLYIENGKVTAIEKRY